MLSLVHSLLTLGWLGLWGRRPSCLCLGLYWAWASAGRRARVVASWRCRPVLVRVWRRAWSELGLGLESVGLLRLLRLLVICWPVLASVPFLTGTFLVLVLLVLLVLVLLVLLVLMLLLMLVLPVLRGQRLNLSLLLTLLPLPLLALDLGLMQHRSGPLLGLRMHRRVVG